MSIQWRSVASNFYMGIALIVIGFYLSRPVDFYFNSSKIVLLGILDNIFYLLTLCILLLVISILFAYKTKNIKSSSDIYKFTAEFFGGLSFFCLLYPIIAFVVGALPPLSITYTLMLFIFGVFLTISATSLFLSKSILYLFVYSKNKELS